MEADVSADGNGRPEVQPLADVVHSITLRKCELIRERLVPRGEPESFSLDEALKLLAPTGTLRARANVARVRVGQFIGVSRSGGSNFVIVNPTSDGDIRWLLRQRPDLNVSIRDIYLVDDVVIQRNTVDLPVGAPGAYQ